MNIRKHCFYNSIKFCINVSVYENVLFSLLCTTCGIRCVYGMRLVYIYGTRRGQRVKYYIYTDEKITDCSFVFINYLWTNSIISTS